MDRGTEKRPRGTVFLALCLHCALLAAVWGAVPPHAEAEERNRPNALELGFTHTFQLLRTSSSEAEAGRSENLFGFVVAYERVLIPDRLALVIAKPFHFTKDRFDSPLDIFLKVPFPRGRWEPYVAAGFSGNARFFSGELEQEEGRRVEYTFGVGAIAGCVYRFTPRWGLSLEVGYLYFVNGLTQHGFIDALSAVWSY